MPFYSKLFVLLGAGNAALAIALGAFGAHALKTRLSADYLAVYTTANHYHITHSLGLILLGIIAWQLPNSTLLKGAGWTMLLGIVLFSGSLYVLAVSGIRWLGAITPLGGLAFIVAWLCIAIAVWRG